jgi:hypothetical protein
MLEMSTAIASKAIRWGRGKAFQNDLALLVEESIFEESLLVPIVKMHGKYTETPAYLIAKQFIALQGFG